MLHHALAKQLAILQRCFLSKRKPLRNGLLLDMMSRPLGWHDTYPTAFLLLYDVVAEGPGEDPPNVLSGCFGARREP